MCIKHNKEALLPHTKCMYTHCGPLAYRDINSIKSEWRGKEEKRARKNISRKILFHFHLNKPHTQLSLVDHSSQRCTGGETNYIIEWAKKNSSSSGEWVVCVRKSIPKKQNEESREIQTYAVGVVVVVFSENLLYSFCSASALINETQPTKKQPCTFAEVSTHTRDRKK